MTQSGLSRYDLKVWDGWKADFVEPGTLGCARCHSPHYSISSALPEQFLFLGALSLKREHEPGRSVSLARRLRLRGWPDKNIILLRRASLPA
jgi:hypothetical protein